MDITSVSQLANLSLTDSEKEELSHQLTRVLDYVSKLSDLSLTDIKPTSQSTNLTNVMREDKVEEGLSFSDKPSYIVPSVINNE